MRNHRVYINDVLTPGADISLHKDISHYIHTVLRLKSGHTLQVFNGDGNEYTAKAIIERKNCSIEIGALSKHEAKKKQKIHLVQAIARGDHMDFALQKATELDVDIITPVITARTQSHDKARLAKRFTHWQNIIIHACEQSGRCYLPTLNAICNYSNGIKTGLNTTKLICHPGNHKTRPPVTENDIAILVGSEGGLTDEEVELAITIGYTPLSLGKNILRTETAATSALAIVQHVLN